MIYLCIMFFFSALHAILAHLEKMCKNVNLVYRFVELRLLLELYAFWLDENKIVLFQPKTPQVDLIWKKYINMWKSTPCPLLSMVEDLRSTAVGLFFY